MCKFASFNIFLKRNTLQHTAGADSSTNFVKKDNLKTVNKNLTKNPTDFVCCANHNSYLF